MANDITKATNEDLDAQIALASEHLNSLAERDDEVLADKLAEIAEFTAPSIEGIEEETRVSIPYILLRQKSTSSDAAPNDCKPGQFFTSAGLNLGNEVEFLPIHTHRIRKKWADEGGIDCSSLDGKTGSRYGSCDACPYGRMEKGVRPDCSPGTAYHVVTGEMDGLYRIEFLKTSAAAGRSIRRTALPPNLWSRKYILTSEQRSGNNGSYFAMKVTPTSDRTGATYDEICKALFEYFKPSYAKALRMHADYAKRLSAGGESSAPAPANGADVIEVSNDENQVIDFSENM